MRDSLNLMKLIRKTCILFRKFISNTTAKKVMQRNVSHFMRRWHHLLVLSWDANDRVIQPKIDKEKTFFSQHFIDCIVNHFTDNDEYCECFWFIQNEFTETDQMWMCIEISRAYLFFAFGKKFTSLPYQH